MKKETSPWCWLLLIPFQLLAAGFFFWIGTRLDLALFSHPGYGHGIPFFAAIFFLIAVVTTILIFILTLVLTIRGLRRR